MVPVQSGGKPRDRGGAFRPRLQDEDASECGHVGHALQGALPDTSEAIHRGSATWDVLIGYGQRGERGSVLYRKLRKNVVEVNFDGSCGEIELPPNLFVWQSCGYQLNNLAFPFRKSRERFLRGVSRGVGSSRPGRPYGQSPSGRDLPQVVDQDLRQHVSGNYAICSVSDSENRLQLRW